MSYYTKRNRSWWCTDVFGDARRHVHAHVLRHAQTIDVCIDRSMGMRMDMCVGMCVDMCIYSSGPCHCSAGQALAALSWHIRNNSIQVMADRALFFQCLGACRRRTPRTRAELKVPKDAPHPRPLRATIRPSPPRRSPSACAEKKVAKIDLHTRSELV